MVQDAEPSEWGKHSIGIANLEAAPAIRQFIDECWLPQHALAVSEPLFNWQQRDDSHERCNYVVAVHRETHQIDALLGFIPLAQFDRALEPYRDLWLAIWKVRELPGTNGLGLALFYWLVNHRKPDTIGSIGISANVIRLYEGLGFELKTLEHYYRLNPTKKTFRLVGGPASAPQTSLDSDSEWTTAPLKAQDFTTQSALQAMIDTHVRPVKSAAYYRRRFLEHPVYEYGVYGVFHRGAVRGFAVIRKIDIEGARALRMVDWQGSEEALGHLGPFVDGWLKRFDAEYIDFYQSGWSAAALERSGFQRRGGDSSVIIPNYFEPFERRNVDIVCAIRQRDSQWPYRIVKADSDQDRPKLIQTLV